MTTIRKIRIADKYIPWLLFAGTIAIYFPAVYFSVDIFDDTSYVNRLFLPDLSELDIRDYLFSPVLGLSSPLVMFSFLLDRLIWRPEILANGMHFTNILCHAAGTVVFYRICRKLTVRISGSSKTFRLKLSPGWSAITVIFWAFHPQRVESVAWISERKDVLLTLFFFCSISFFIDSYRKSKISLAAIVLFVASLAVKPMLLTMPAILWVWMKTESGKFFSKRNIVQLIPYCVICSGLLFFYIFFRNITPFAADCGTVFFRLKIIFWNIANYFRSAVVPTELMPFYPFYSPAYYSLFPAFIFPVCVCVLAIAGRKTDAVKNIILPVLLLFPVTLLPVCGIHRIGNVDWADRYNIIPSLFLLFPAIFLMNYWGRKYVVWQKYTVLGCVCYALFLISTTISYLPCWKSLSTVKFASTADVPNPNYRIMFLHAMTAFLNNDFVSTAEISAKISENSVCTPYDKKMIRVYHTGIIGLLQSAGNFPDAGGKTLTKLLLSEDIRYCARISSEFVDIAVAASVYWNLHKKDIATAIKLYETAAAYSGSDYGGQIMQIQAAFLKNDFVRAQQILSDLQKKIPDSNVVAALKKQLDVLQSQNQKKTI